MLRRIRSIFFGRGSVIADFIMELDGETSFDNVSDIEVIIMEDLGNGNFSSEALNVSIGVDSTSLNVTGMIIDAPCTP